MMRRVSLREGFSADDVSEDTHTYESVLCRWLLKMRHRRRAFGAYSVLAGSYHRSAADRSIPTGDVSVKSWGSGLVICC